MDEWKQNHFNLFWSKMIGIYGKRWITEHGSEPSEVWCEALQRFSFERIKMAIAYCIDSGDEFPVTLPLFVRRAKAMRVPSEHNEDFKQLPKPDITQEQLEAAQQKLHIASNQLKIPARGKRRSILLPGENYNDYLMDLAKCATKQEREQCIIDRLAKNGWTETDERNYRAATRGIQYRLDKEERHYNKVNQQKEPLPEVTSHWQDD